MPVQEIDLRGSLTAGITLAERQQHDHGHDGDHSHGDADVHEDGGVAVAAVPADHGGSLESGLTHWADTCTAAEARSNHNHADTAMDERQTRQPLLQTAAAFEGDSPTAHGQPQEAHHLLEHGAALSDLAGVWSGETDGGSGSDVGRCSWPPLWLILLLIVSGALLYHAGAFFAMRNSASHPFQAALLHPSFPGTALCPSSRHAFMFFCVRPSADVLSFAVELSAQTPFGVFVVVDDESYEWADAARHPKVHVVNMAAGVARRRNITHMGWPVKQRDAPRAVVAMDKAMAFAAYLYDDDGLSFQSAVAAATTGAANADGTHGDGDGASSSSRRLRYCRVWFIEDDTFIPSVGAAVRLDRLASDFDYVAPAAVLFKGARDPWPHWSHIKRFDNQPGIPGRSSWRHQMANALGVSDRYLRQVRAFARRRGRLLFSEVFLPTLAHAHSLSVWNPPDDMQLHWRVGVGVGGGVGVGVGAPKDRLNWDWDGMMQYREPQRIWWHPMKNNTMRTQLRAKFKQFELDPEQQRLQQRQWEELQQLQTERLEKEQREKQQKEEKKRQKEEEKWKKKKQKQQEKKDSQNKEEKESDKEKKKKRKQKQKQRPDGERWQQPGQPEP